MKWRVKKQCDNCPFATSGPGLRLRRHLNPGRWRGILAGLRNETHFVCHKTAEYEGDEDVLVGPALVCAGSIEWQHKRGLKSRLERLIEAFEGKAKTKLHILLVLDRRK